MRLIYLIALLILTACTQISSEPRIVHMPELPSKYTRPLPQDCEWKQKTIGVFNQASQLLSFRYQDCTGRSHNKNETNFYYADFQNGGAIFTKYQKGSVEFNEDKSEVKFIKSGPWLKDIKIHIWKQGSSNPNDFFGEIMGENYSCELFPVADNQYLIVRSDFRNKSDFEVIFNEPAAEFVARYNMYEAINGDGWTNRQDCDGFNLRLAVFEGGLIFIFQEASASHIDLSSITYTNNG